MTPPVTTTRVLLVEDNPGDALLVTEMFDQAEPDRYQVVHVPRLADAIDTLRTEDVDVVVLDLRLEDSSGLDGVRVLREAASQVPIVVLTGSDDEQLALACIDAGAQDYLAKAEARAHTLQRAIGYAITRIREAQLHELQKTLERYRALSSSAQGTTVTAALAGSGAVSVRHPDAFETLVRAYGTLLEPYLQRRSETVNAPRRDLERIVTELGDAGGGPRDLLDLHVTALDRAIAIQPDPHSRSIVFEARLLALEMMGLLVDYYRVGQRRRRA